jgi:hypothetical protein
MNTIAKTTMIGGPKKYILASFNLLKVIALFGFALSAGSLGFPTSAGEMFESN